MNTASTLVLRVTAIVALASPLHGQNPSPAPGALPSFEQALREARTGIGFEKTGFTGSGAPVLQKAIAESRFVLIGEDHFTREIPRFATAVCDLMATQGLFALATEASPQAANFVGATLEAPDRTAQLTALLKKYPDSVAFLNSVPENELATHAAQATKAAGGAGFQLWGLDQEFLGSAGWLLDQILATHPGPAATAALTRLQTEEQKDAALAREDGDPSKLLLFSANDTALTEIDTLLQREGSPAANELFRALLESREIYLKDAQGSSDANAQRARLLKRNFRQRLEAATAAGQTGKVLVKLGDWHVYKGFNPLRQRDLGNYIAERADEEGSGSLHICVLGAKGTHRLYGGYARPLRTEPFVMTDDSEYRWLKPAVDNQLAESWTLYDLRRLRSRKLGPVDPAMSRLIEGCDLLVVIPELTPADPIE